MVRDRVSTVRSATILSLTLFLILGAVQALRWQRADRQGITVLVVLGGRVVDSEHNGKQFWRAGILRYRNLEGIQASAGV